MKYIYKLSDNEIISYLMEIFNYKNIEDITISRGNNSPIIVRFKADIGEVESIWVDESFSLEDTSLNPGEFYYFDNQHDVKWQRLLYHKFGENYLLSIK